MRYVCKELISHPTFKSDLVVGSACFDYSVLFTLPRNQAVFHDCFIVSVSLGGWRKS